MRNRRLGQPPSRLAVLGDDRLSVPIKGEREAEEWPAYEADWAGLCTLDMAPLVWDWWRSRPHTVTRARAALGFLRGQTIEVSLRLGDAMLYRAIYRDVRHDPERGFRLVLSAVAARTHRPRVDARRWQEYPLRLFAGAPSYFHFLWSGGSPPEGPLVLRCPNEECGFAAVGRFCTRCGAVVRRRRQGMGPLLAGVYRLWREAGVSGRVSACRCGGVFYRDGIGRWCAKCGLSVDAVL